MARWSRSRRMSQEYLHSWKAKRGYYELGPPFRWLSDEECDHYEGLKREHADALRKELPPSEFSWRRLFGLVDTRQQVKLDKDEVRERVDMRDLAESYGAKMRGSGKRPIGSCPLHEDRLASFSLDLDRKLFNCFAGCGGGDCFTLVMRKESVTFYEAVKILNQRY